MRLQNSLGPSNNKSERDNDTKEAEIQAKKRTWSHIPDVNNQNINQ